ncbi:hypothetical protein ACFTWF_35100 [Rhodococcus sp. NPDC056960]|uniref:hypothetical protein n=1 Tax=Rhodococcus sp. NPDC056960 TaxID=3345982 RepID=UPI003636F326
MLLTALTTTTDLLAQDKPPVIDFDLTAPPGGMEDKTKVLLGVLLWVVTIGLIGIAVWAGFAFAQAFADGTASRGQKLLFGVVAVGAIMATGAASWVSFFM